MTCCGCAPEIGQMQAGTTEFGSVDFTEKLADGELLTGTPSATQTDGSELTIDQEQLDTGSQIVLFRVRSPETDSGRHTIRVTATTDDANRTDPLTTDIRLEICEGCCG